MEDSAAVAQSFPTLEQVHGAERGPLGLVEVHKPSGPPVATIVGVHQPGGGSVRTWSNFNVDPPFFWLRDGLAVDFPRHRVLSFGYSGTTRPRTEGLSKAKDNPTNLLHLLDADIGKARPATPIIFLAYGPGGNLVKRALIHSALSPAQTVHRQTIAVLFFGTSHRGADPANKPKQPPKPEKAPSLPGADRRETQITNEGWLHVSHKYTVVNFYETMPMLTSHGVRAIAVNKGSATMNTPNEIVYALRATHRSLVKFTGRDDPSYNTVCGALRIIESRARERPVVGSAAGATPPASAGGTPAEEPQRIDFEGYVFGIGDGGIEVEESHSVTDLHERSPIELLSAAATAEGAPSGRLPFYWVHIPLTHTAWVNPCLQSIAASQNTDLLIMENKYWLSRERKSRYNLPHSRHFDPSSFIQTTPSTTQLVLYLPYIHWDTLDCFSRWSNYLKAANRGVPLNIPDGLQPHARAVYAAMRDDCRKTSSLHPRRTLDQFFYSSLLDTASRDGDQVVSKNTINYPGGRKMIMVDQLWLWVLATGEDAAILTCFPQKYEEEGEECFHGIADLRRAVVDEVNGRGETWIAKPGELVAVLLDQAVNGMLGVRNEQSLDFLGVFRTAIAEATEAHASYFHQFQVRLSSKASDIRDLGTKRKEVKLALYIADILDELNSIDRLFEAQVDALTELVHNVRPHDEVFGGLVHKVENLVERDIATYRKQVRRMMEDARRTKDNLVELLDLQQKEETLREAQNSNLQAAAAREQADETAAQSQILFLFTIVTIIFLPLSFFTSYFGMNVTEITGEEGNTAHGAVWRVMGPISGTVIVGLLGTAFYLYRRTRRRQEERMLDDGK